MNMYSTSTHPREYIEHIGGLETTAETIEYEAAIGRAGGHIITEELNGAIIEEIFIYSRDASISTVINTNRSGLIIDNYIYTRARNCKYTYSCLPNIFYGEPSAGNNFWAFDLSAVESREIKKISLCERNLVCLEMQKQGTGPINFIQISRAVAYMPLVDYIGICRL